MEIRSKEDAKKYENLLTTFEKFYTGVGAVTSAPARGVRAVGRFVSSKVSKVVGDNEPLVAKISPVQSPKTDQFPEHTENIIAPPWTEKGAGVIGLAFSGGGSRAHTLTVGYLRGLHNLKVGNNANDNFLHHVEYMSAVSGGSWASSIFCYADESRDELLGPLTNPELFTLEYLEDMDIGKACEVIPRFSAIRPLIGEMFWGHSEDELWQYIVSNNILKPFKLNKTFVALDKGHAEEIVRRNPVLKRKTFKYVRRDGDKRPFLIINTTLSGPKNYGMGPGASFQITPMYSGVPFYRNLEKLAFEKSSGEMAGIKGYSKAVILTVGGGFIETFALNSKGPVNDNDRLFYSSSSLTLSEESKSSDPEIARTDSSDSGNSKSSAKDVPLRQPKRYFTLAHAVGASSAAYAATFSNSGMGMNFIPKITYWPLHSKEFTQFSNVQKHVLLGWGDGGNFENTGIVPLIQRGLRKVICFINNEEPLDQDFQPNIFIDRSSEEPKFCASNQLLALFGIIETINFGYVYKDSQIFAESDLNDVMNGLIANIKAGKGAVSRHLLMVQPNKFWNIAGGYKVDVIFVYNEQVKRFEEVIQGRAPVETLNPNYEPETTFEGRLQQQKSPGTHDDNNEEKIPDKLDLSEKGEFANFPFYKTMLQNGRDLFSLTKVQTALLSSQAEWIIKMNSDIFLDFFNNVPIKKKIIE